LPHSHFHDVSVGGDGLGASPRLWGRRERGSKRRGAFGSEACHQGAHHCQSSVDRVPVYPAQGTGVQQPAGLLSNTLVS